MFVEAIVPFNGDGWLSPTGRFLATRSEDRKTISFWELKTMSRCGPDLKMESEVWSIAWSPTEKHIATSSKDGALQKWGDIYESAKVVAESTQEHRRAGLEYSPDDRLIASVSRTAKLWDASNLSLVWEYPGDWVCFSSVAFHPFGHRVVLVSGNPVVDVNVEALGDITATERGLDFDVKALVFDPSGITCAAWTPKDVKILSADLLKETTSLLISYVKAMRFTPDGKHILLVLALLGTKMLILWDTASRAIVQQLTIDIPEFSLWSARISNDCRAVHVGDFKGTSHVIHLTY